MTCQDCTHYNICSLWSTTDLDEDEAYKHCFGNFKNSADVVEVVRCEKCKHLEVINDGKVYAKCRMTDFEFLPFGTDTRKHYCGYSERIEE